MVTFVILTDIYEYRFDIDIDVGHHLVILVANVGDHLEIIAG